MTRHCSIGVREKINPKRKSNRLSKTQKRECFGVEVVNMVDGR